MTLAYSTIAKNAAANAIASLINSAGRGYVQLRTGAKPATPDTAVSGTLLATFTLQTTSFSDAVGGVISANGLPLTGNIVASGTAGWFRVFKGNGAAVLDGTITITDGGGDMEIDNLTFVSGGTVSVQALSFNQVNA